MLFLKKNYKKIVLILILLILLAYVANISYIPQSLILFENEELNVKSIFGIKLEETIQVGANLNKKNKKFSSQTKKEYNLSLLGFNLKTITASIVPNTKVIPIGHIAGLKLNTKGVLVVGVSGIKGKDNKIYKPYEDAGIKLGDSIVEINGQVVETTEELIACVSKSNGKDIQIKYLNNGEILNTTLKPVKTSDSSYKIGLWVRDTAVGVGTLTFLEPSSNLVAALGHAIQDVDTEEIIDIDTGELVTSDIIEIKKGEKNKPGKIQGTIENSQKIGEIYANTEFGIYGKIESQSKLNISNFQEVEVASRKEINPGKASIICMLENGIRKEYEVQIEKVYINNHENNKSMLVKVTDKELLEKTGGIIQGMSGSPVLQNGKLIGALTHVLVQKPDTGYAVFADMMIKQMRTAE